MKRLGVMGLTALCLLFSACGRAEEFPQNAPDAAEYGNMPEEEDSERKKLEKLQKEPSVYWAVIEHTPTKFSYYGREQYKIELDSAFVSVWINESEREEYLLDEGQAEALGQLISEYALTVYDGSPYWPTGEYCTMIELFTFDVSYDKGYYQESGALKYPEDWDSFMEKLRELVYSGEKVQESTGQDG